MSRAYADGLTATTLRYSVYDVKAGKFVAVNEAGETEGTATFTNLQATVTVQLAKAKSYKFYFWADCGEGSPYTIDYTTKQVKVDYSQAVGNMESYDAFYGAAEVAVNGSLDQTVTLHRPFAQLNIGTNDLKAAANTGFEAKNVTVTLSSINNALSLESGIAVDTAVVKDVTFSTAAIPTGETFPVAGYEYLSMNYILVGSEKTTTDVTLTVDDGNGTSGTPMTFATVPVQQNYRTNIYGSLLTNPYNFQVVIDPAFNTPDYDHAWAYANFVNDIAKAKDGDTVTVPANLDLSEGIPAITSDITLEIPAGVTVTTYPEFTTSSAKSRAESEVYPYFYVPKGVTVTLTGNGKVISERNPFQVDGKLIVENCNIETTNENRGSAIIVNEGGELVFNNGYVNAGRVALYITGIGTINGGTIISNTELGGYAVVVFGKDSYLTVNGGYIQANKGCLGFGDQDVNENTGGGVINDGEFVVTSNKRYPYYAIFIWNYAVTVKGGYFYSPNTTCYIYNSNNSKISFEGGFFNIDKNDHLKNAVGEGFYLNEVETVFNNKTYTMAIKEATAAE
jgi:hypothetical protein